MKKNVNTTNRSFDSGIDGQHDICVTRNENTYLGPSYLHS